MYPLKISRAFIAPFTALALAGCGSEDSVTDTGTEDGPVYAMMVQVYGPEDRTVYVPLSDSVDLGSTNLEDAREFGGVANLAAIGGRLLVSAGGAPEITEFEVDASGIWRQGRSVDFGAYPLSDNANFYYQFVVDEHTAILPYEGTKRILWDPANMEITGELEDTRLEHAEPGLALEAGGNRNGVHYDGAVMQALFYHDDDWYDYGSTSHVLVYDPDSFEEQRIVDVPCPGLSLATRDEDGNTYFSSWDLPTTSLLGSAPPNCVAEFDRDGSLERTIDLREWTGGRYVNNFRYIAGGKAFGNVLHHERLGVDDPAELDDERLDRLTTSGDHWVLWLFDLTAESAEPVEGIDVSLGSGAQFAILDGRTFVFVPFDEWSKTRVYELDQRGTATARFDTVGDVFKWVQVR